MQKETKRDEGYIKFLANKYTTQPADRDDLLQILRIKKWQLKDNPNQRDILKWTARKWYNKKKKEPVTIPWSEEFSTCV